MLHRACLLSETGRRSLCARSRDTMNFDYTASQLKLIDPGCLKRNGPVTKEARAAATEEISNLAMSIAETGADWAVFCPGPCNATLSAGTSCSATGLTVWIAPDDDLCVVPQLLPSKTLSHQSRALPTFPSPVQCAI